ncbi:cytochrome c [Nitrogeniibacter aestuarii]|uniref:cytochrome c n=1 Tax=Nitrogeniibacter aestuarii TaxID=2815343 RepID=UPI001E616F18|nr:cytochrome c [Nitrogeniibacter aestuarii]
MRLLRIACLIATTSLTLGATAAEDTREMVQMPPTMQAHMLANMRDHMKTIDGILRALSERRFDAAAELAEQRLGMSSLDDHGASHMARVMPPAMQAIGTGMHRAASRFALRAQEEDAPAAYQALTEVTGACVACHDGYRIR